MTEKVHTESRFYINISYLRPVFDFLRRAQEPLPTYLSILGIDEEDLSRPDLRVPAEAMNKLFDRAMNQLQDADVGLAAAKSMQVHHLGIVGLLVMSCRYAHEIFELHARFQTLVGNSLDTQYFINEDRCYLESRMAPGHEPFSRQSIDFVFGGWWNLKRTLVGDLHKPLRIEFPYSKPDDTSQLEAMFSAPLSFGHETLRVHFDAKNLDVELLPADSELKQVIEGQAKQRLNKLHGEQADVNPYLASVKEIIADRLAFGVPSIDDIAVQLGVSGRTVQRQLGQHGSGYTELLEQVHRDLAGRYIENQDLSLLDVAMMLGFSEQSSFHRAFKRWFNCTPGEYRKRSLGN